MTWTLRDQAKRDNSPPLQGRGRGWGLTAVRNEEIAGFAHEMRNNPTAPEKRLWAALRRMGFAVLHVTNADVMRNIEGALTAILGALEAALDRWERPHLTPSSEGEGQEG